MDTEGYPLERITDKSLPDTVVRVSKSKTHSKRHPGQMENGNSPLSSLPNEVNSREQKKSNGVKLLINSEQSNEPTSISRPINQRVATIDVTSITDDEENERAIVPDVEHPDSTAMADQATMLSSYTTGGDNDIIEIHQFTATDVEPYLDIYFETLNNRLRHHIGDNEQLQLFRNSMQNRIITSENSREFSNVLLGKINGDIVAAVTMAFHGEAPTVPLGSSIPGQNSCFRSVKRWMTRRANYLPRFEHECYIEMIGVKSSFRNRGVGAAMLQCIERFAQQAGATLLTIHISGDPLRNYFERADFHIDPTDYSGFWKSMVERESTLKLAKEIREGQENPADYPTENYFDGSVVESIEE